MPQQVINQGGIILNEQIHVGFKVVTQVDVKLLSDEEMLECLTTAIQYKQYCYSCHSSCECGGSKILFVKLYEENFLLRLLLLFKFKRKGKEREMSNKFMLIMRYGSVMMNTLFALGARMTDEDTPGELTLPEILDTFEEAIRNVVPSIDNSKFERLNAITSKEELNKTVFKDGDVIILIPGELTNDLKIKV